jgi:hypothetical protein
MVTQSFEFRYLREETHTARRKLKTGDTYSAPKASFILHHSTNTILWPLFWIWIKWRQPPPSRRTQTSLTTKEQEKSILASTALISIDTPPSRCKQHQPKPPTTKEQAHPSTHCIDSAQAPKPPNVSYNQGASASSSKEKSIL